MAETVGPGMGGSVFASTFGSNRKCKCAYSWEWDNGALVSPPALQATGDPCPVAEQTGHPCMPPPWQPVRVFHLTASASTPREGELCNQARNRAALDARHAEEQARPMYCHYCQRQAGPPSRWALGCTPRELPPGVETWELTFWTERGDKMPRSGRICPSCAAIRAAAFAEGRSVIVTMTHPPTVSIGDKVRGRRG